MRINSSWVKPINLIRKWDGIEFNKLFTVNKWCITAERGKGWGKKSIKCSRQHENTLVNYVRSVITQATSHYSQRKELNMWWEYPRWLRKGNGLCRNICVGVTTDGNTQSYCSNQEIIRTAKVDTTPAGNLKIWASATTSTEHTYIREREGECW